LDIREKERKCLKLNKQLQIEKIPKIDSIFLFKEVTC
jgi:hypothetical protein